MPLAHRSSSVRFYTASVRSSHSPSAGKMSFIDAVWAWGRPLLGPMPFAASDPLRTLTARRITCRLDYYSSELFG